MAKKINKVVGKAFAKMIADKTYGMVGSVWTNGVTCYYDDDPWAIRQFVYHTDHSWGTAYCDWSGDTKYELIDFLREAGATNIKADVKWNRINITFNIKQAKYKQLCKEMGIDPEEVQE